MGDHYFSQTPSSSHDSRTFSFVFRERGLRFETDAGVFSKKHVDKGTDLLVSSLPLAFSGRALDLGCGWGAVGACMASAWPEARIVMADVNARAAALARKNLAANRLTAQVLESDGFSAVEGMFGLIATNPPIRAGKAVVYRLFTESASRLCEDGALYIVIRKQQGADSAQKYLSTLFESVDIVERGAGFRVFRASAPIQRRTQCIETTPSL